MADHVTSRRGNLPNISVGPDHRDIPSANEIRRIGLEAGLHAIGFTHTEPFRETRVALETRKAQGRSSDMNFTFRNPARSTDPRRIVRGAQTLIVGAWPYAHEPDPASSSSQGARPQAQVAAYAWRDHYGDLRRALGAIVEPLRAAGWKARAIADDNALVDRSAALRAGIGWAGKNSNVLVAGRGSWFVLGAVVTDAPYAAGTPILDQCGPCRRCITGCPTDAIVADGVVDARRCLAWLLQSPSEFPVELRPALGTRIYGCDDCQTVCPPSRNSPVQRVGDEVGSHDLLDMLEMSDEDLLAIADPWYIPQRDLRIVRRNALIGLGNLELAKLAPEVRAEALATLDRYEYGAPEQSADPMLASYARWSRAQITRQGTGESR